MATINLALNVQVVGGPQVLISKAKSVEAYDSIEVSVVGGATDQVVEIQPGAASRVSFLLIQSSLYSQSGASSKFTYKVGDGSNPDSIAVDLDEPHFYLGVGAVSVLGIAPKLLKFSSTYPADAKSKATVTILVGRDATP
jgi:hypothetical protein